MRGTCKLKGTVYWITGLSGAGKTTIGKLLYRRLKQEKENVLFLDGDILREVYGNDLGYSKEERLKGAMRNSRMCQMISNQNVDVVCCTISMFDKVRQWNRKNIENYQEIFLDVPLEILKQRDQKGLYTDVQLGYTKNIVGMDLKLEIPQSSDIILINDGNRNEQQIFEELKQKLNLK